MNPLDANMDDFDGMPEEPNRGDLPPMPAVAQCWRCDKFADAATGFCPFCEARLGPAAATASRPASPNFGMHPLSKVIIAYSIMLATALVWGWIVHFHGRLDHGDHLLGTAILEGFDAILVLLTALAIGRLSITKPATGVRVAAWVAAPFILAFVLAVNVAYRWVLMEFLGHGWLTREFALPEWSTVSVLLVAVQPAVVEEWFFRYLALGAVRSATGMHAAVWVSATMFAMAHIYNPLGLPWLLVAGVTFGYARVASGGLALPMLLHFSHNAAILRFQGWI